MFAIASRILRKYTHVKFFRSSGGKNLPRHQIVSHSSPVVVVVVVVFAVNGKPIVAHNNLSSQLIRFSSLYFYNSHLSIRRKPLTLALRDNQRKRSRNIQTTTIINNIAWQVVQLPPAERCDYFPGPGPRHCTKARREEKETKNVCCQLVRAAARNDDGVQQQVQVYALCCARDLDLR